MKMSFLYEKKVYNLLFKIYMSIITNYCVVAMHNRFIIIFKRKICKCIILIICLYYTDTHCLTIIIN